MIQLINISKKYQKKKETFSVFENLNLTFPSHGLILITGKSGIGKTTLLNLIAGLDTPNNGQIRINNTDITKLKETERTIYRQKNISMIFQKDSLFENLTVAENVSLLVDDPPKMEQILKFLDISSLKNKKGSDLSGGEQQRVAIARCLMMDTPILLGDEITASLDPQNAKNIITLLKTLSQTKLIILVSHDRTLIRNYADIEIDLENQKRIEYSKVSFETEIPNSLKEYPLTFKKQLKFALSHLTSYKKKSIFAILMLALTFFSFIVSYSINHMDIAKIHARSLIKENKPTIILMKNSLYGENSFTKEEIESIKALTKNPDNVQISTSYYYAENRDRITFNVPFDLQGSDPTYYYGYMITANCLEINETTLPNNAKIIGQMPTKPNEILVTERMADLIVYHGILTENGRKKFASKEELFTSNEILLKDIPIKITGYLKQDLEKYQIFKEIPYNKVQTSKYNRLYDLFEGSIPIHPVYVTKDFATIFSKPLIKEIHVIYVQENNRKTIEKILKTYPLEKNKITSVTSLSLSIQTVITTLNTIAKTFFYITIIAGILTFIILINSIENSLINCRKEILIQKSLGIPNQSIKQIFLLENLIMNTISFLFALIGTKIIYMIGNTKISTELLFSFSPLRITPSTLILIFISILLTTFFMTILLLWKIDSAKPVDIMRTN